MEGKNAELAELGEEESHFEVVAQSEDMLLALRNKLDLKVLSGLGEKKVLKSSLLLSRMERLWPWWSWTRSWERYLCPSGSRRGPGLSGQKDSQVSCRAWFHLHWSEVSK